jgi:hypothetical protein
MKFRPMVNANSSTVTRVGKKIEDWEVAALE